jgi:hypothetical protein
MTAQHLPKLKTNFAQWPVLCAVGQLYNLPESYFERLMDLKNKVHLKSLKLQLLSWENFVRYPVDLSPGVLGGGAMYQLWESSLYSTSVMMLAGFFGSEGGGSK